MYVYIYFITYIQLKKVMLSKLIYKVYRYTYHCFFVNNCHLNNLFASQTRTFIKVKHNPSHILFLRCKTGIPLTNSLSRNF